MKGFVLSPSDFVAVFNQSLEITFPNVIIEGEIANFRISRNKWVYFDLQDEAASIKIFGSIYRLPGPIEDGLNVQVLGYPRLHPKYGLSINVESIAPVGEGSIKKTAELLRSKLEAEGLFEASRKRRLPAMPKSVGLITAFNSAAYFDFVKIINERWGGLDVYLVDVLVQGINSPQQIVAAIDHFNKLPMLPEVLVITRGGGSADDLASFNDERVVRAVAASRIPTLVAVGHEVNIILAELAADLRASTPTNAAQLVVPNKNEILRELAVVKAGLGAKLDEKFELSIEQARSTKKYLTSQIISALEKLGKELASSRKLADIYNPLGVLKRGYAIVSMKGEYISSVSSLAAGDRLSVRFSDGTISAKVEDQK